MRISLHKTRYHLGWRDAFYLFWKAQTGSFTRLRLKSYQHPIYLNGYQQDYGLFESLLISKDYDFRLPFSPLRIVDAGANIGLASVWFANRYPGAHIIAIEPDGQNWQLLEKNTSAYPQISRYHAALWSSKASLSLDRDPNTNTSTSVRPAGTHESETIPTITLSELMDLHGWETIDLLKMDIEGAEKEMFSHHASDWIRRTKFIAVETHDRRLPGCSKSVFRALDAFNFSMEPQKECLLFYNEDLINKLSVYHQ